nr:unnamed protein product [Callosobruchus chinensis]
MNVDKPTSEYGGLREIDLTLTTPSMGCKRNTGVLLFSLPLLGISITVLVGMISAFISNCTFLSLPALAAAGAELPPPLPSSTSLPKLSNMTYRSVDNGNGSSLFQAPFLSGGTKKYSLVVSKRSFNPPETGQVTSCQGIDVCVFNLQLARVVTRITFKLVVCLETSSKSPSFFKSTGPLSSSKRTKPPCFKDATQLLRTLSLLYCKRSLATTKWVSWATLVVFTSLTTCLISLASSALVSTWPPDTTVTWKEHVAELHGTVRGREDCSRGRQMNSVGPKEFPSLEDTGNYRL